MEQVSKGVILFKNELLAPDTTTAATLIPSLESLLTLRLWPSPLSLYPHPLKLFPQPHLLRLLLASAPWLITAQVI